MAASVFPGSIVPSQRGRVLPEKSCPHIISLPGRKKKKFFFATPQDSSHQLEDVGHQQFEIKGMFMLSIKGWAVIKTHFFYLNECKLAHLLWWASCPDSSISMIDQLSSCWWLSGGNGGCSGDGDGSWGDEVEERGGWGEKEWKGGGGGRKWSKTFFSANQFLCLFDSIRRNSALLIFCFRVVVFFLSFYF